MSLVGNERIKLLATMVNTVGTAAIVAGVVTPVVAYTYGFPGAQPTPFSLLATFSWLSVGAGLHLVAQAILGLLKE
jgi:hypothetical protein